MKKTFLKATVAVLLICATVFCFAACGSTAGKVKDAESASGNFGGIEWSYDEKTYVLDIKGSGEISFESAEAADWYEVRHSVKEINMSEGITKIGNYAFYYMPELTDVDIPDSVTALGDYAFAFCSSLDGVELPAGLTSIGNSCFETCISLKAIFVPSSVTSIGARAFAHCSSLESARIMAKISSIGEWTFKGCSSLGTLCFHTDVQNNVTVAENAFEDCKIGFAGAVFTASDSGAATLTINYVYEDGSKAAESYQGEYVLNSPYNITSPAIEGYTPDAAVKEGYVNDYNTVVTVTYKKIAETEAQTEAKETVAAEEKEPEKSKVGNIVAIVIMVVVILAIVALVVFMIISDKKNAAKSNGRNGGKGNGKNGRKK